MGRMETIKMGFVEAVDFKLPALRGGRVASPVATTSIELKAVVEARVQALLDAHANNMIEGLDSGAGWRKAILELARLPISNEEFAARAEALG
jgi:hypothetical protein